MPVTQQAQSMRYHTSSCKRTVFLSVQQDRTVSRQSMYQKKLEGWITIGVLEAGLYNNVGWFEAYSVAT
jgi:hypothetical protein